MPPQIIKLAAVGDIALTHSYDQLLSTKGPHYPFEEVREFLKKQDIVFGNLEAPLSLSGKPFPLKCCLQSNPEYAFGLKNAGFNIVSLANNHILDYKEDAFYDTLKSLKQYGIKCFGAGKNIQEARKPAIIDINNIKIGFLGYCDVAIDSPFYASNSERGITDLKLEYLEEDIKSLNKVSDLIIVSLHWGVENCSYPTPMQIETAHQIIDYGANLILGHHPHVLQGVEKYNKGYIAYSLGNFIFCNINWSWTNKEGKKIKSTVKLEKKNRMSVILMAVMDKTGIKKLELVPCAISDTLQPEVQPNSKKIKREINRVSKRIKIKNYPVFWYSYSRIQKFAVLLRKSFRLIRKLHKIRICHFAEFIKYLKKCIAKYLYLI